MIIVDNTSSLLLPIVLSQILLPLESTFIIQKSCELFLLFSDLSKDTFEVEFPAIINPSFALTISIGTSEFKPPIDFCHFH